jgi:hypothetical protein
MIADTKPVAVDAAEAPKTEPVIDTEKKTITTVNQDGSKIVQHTKGSLVGAGKVQFFGADGKLTTTLNADGTQVLHRPDGKKDIKLNAHLAYCKEQWDLTHPGVEFPVYADMNDNVILLKRRERKAFASQLKRKAKLDRKTKSLLNPPVISDDCPLKAYYLRDHEDIVAEQLLDTTIQKIPAPTDEGIEEMSQGAEEVPAGQDQAGS